jgi:hypothetical protein
MTMRTHDDLRDDRFDEAWKRASSETPSSALDDAIRAAARREVGARPHDIASVPEATRPERWWFPLAAAATIGAIAIGLLQITTPDKLASVDERRPVSDIPPGAKETAAPRAEPAATPPGPAAPATPPPPAAPPTASRESLAKQAPAQSNTRVDESKRDRQLPRRQTPAPQEQAPAPSVSSAAPAAAPSLGATAPAAPPATLAAEPQAFPAARDEARLAAPAPAPASPASKKTEAANEPSIVAQSAPVERSSRGAALAPKPMLKSQADKSESAGDSVDSAASGTLDAVSARAKMRASLPTEQWIVLMRRLLNEQHFDELAKELAAFRTLHADANALLPEDLRNFQPPPEATR